MPNVRDRREKAAKAEVIELIGEVGSENTARFLNVHSTTVKRWKAGTMVPPDAVLIALRALAKGQLPGMEHKWWEGWSFGRDGHLYGPARNQKFHPGDLMAIQYEKALIAHQRRRIKELEEAIRRLNQADSTGAANDPIEGQISGVG